VSYDRQIDQACPHHVLQEALFLDTDGSTVRPIRPVATAVSVAVRLNRAIDVPSAGVRIAASVNGSRQGPFDITSSNNTVSLRLAGDALQEVVLPASKGLNADLVAEYLNPRLRGVFFDVKGSRLAMRTLDVGRPAAVFVLPASTFLSHIGIPTNREYRGKQVAPGWSLINDPLTLPDRPARLIVFDEPLRGHGDFVEISYITLRSECRRCGGVGKENDWRYGLNGEVVQVVDEALLIQEVSKVFYTRRGSNPFHTWYGSGIFDAIGRKITPDGFVENFIVSDLQQAFRRWQSIKKIQEENAGQDVSDREYPFNLQDVQLKQSSQDPTVVFVKCTIQNRSSEPIVLERGVRFPVPLSLVEPNSAQGVVRGSLSDFVLVE